MPSFLMSKFFFLWRLFSVLLLFLLLSVLLNEVFGQHDTETPISIWRWLCAPLFLLMFGKNLPLAVVVYLSVSLSSTFINLRELTLVDRFLSKVQSVYI